MKSKFHRLGKTYKGHH